jgi:uncharacterized cupredoxin-like copper-binding protein
VNVELDEFTIVSNPSAAPAGTITFSVANVGDEGHEFRIIKTDLSPDAIPTEVDGSYAEHGPGTEIIDEIGFIPPGGEAQLTVDLEAGAYVLICNFIDVDGGHVEAHYMEGMRDGFTVD